MSPRPLLVALALLLPVAVACGKEAPPAGPPEGDAQAAARAANALAADLYRAIGDEDGNRCFSPYSISTALGMLRAGARGATARRMDEILHLPADGLSGAQGRLAHDLIPRATRERLRRRPAYALQIANGLWGQAAFPFAEPFVETLRSDYGATVRTLDFGDPRRAAGTINAWVSDRTRGKIGDLVPASALTEQTRLVLTNAIWFKAAWAEDFPQGATKEAPFRTGGGEVRVRMMGNEERFGYGETATGAQVLRLPYKRGALSMIVVLPREDDGLAALEKELSSATLRAWAEATKDRRRVQVRFPRFEFRSRLALKAVLSRMGLASLFDPEQANLGGIIEDDRAWVGAVIHEAWIAVDEEGTEAAAATAVAVEGEAAEPEEPVRFVADHPFLFFIHHRETGAILFLGRVVDPKA